MASETAKPNQDETDESAEPTQNQAYDLFRQTQAAFADVVRTWTESFSRLTPSLPTSNIDPDALRADEAIDSAFDFAEQVLASQRQMAHRLIDATKPLFDVVAKQQREFVEQGERVQREFVDQIERQREAEREQAEREQAELEQAEREQARRERQEAKSKYENMTLVELRDAAAEAGIEGRS
jgi:hypothetical protein